MEHSLSTPLRFNQSAPNTQSSPLNSSKFDVLCRLRHDSYRNMTSRLASYEWWLNSLPPGQEKVSNARGMIGGGGGWC